MNNMKTIDILFALGISGGAEARRLMHKGAIAFNGVAPSNLDTLVSIANINEVKFGKHTISGEAVREKLNE